MKSIKHLVECHCTLSIYKGVNSKIIYHKFPVFSKIDENDNVINKIVQCNNCSVVHKIYDLCKSEILGGKDDFKVGLTLEEIGMQLPTRLENLLIKSKCDMSTWEHALDVIEEKQWGEKIILSRQIIDSKLHVKILEILSEDKFKLTNRLIDDEIVLMENNNETR